MARHLTIPQAAVVAQVRAHVMRSIVEQGRLASECRMPRRDRGEITARSSVPQHMIDPADLEALMADAKAWKRACDGAYTAPPSASKPRLTREQRGAGKKRKRLEDLIEAKRIGIPVEEWAL